MKNNVVILNGPIGAGKDAIAKELCRTCFDFNHLEFKRKLHELACAFTGISQLVWFSRYKNRSLKETPWEKLPKLNSLGSCGVLSSVAKDFLKRRAAGDHLTQREYFIYLSEDVIKPTFGKRYFGEVALKLIRKFAFEQESFVFSDGGFIEELEVLAEDPNLNIVLVHLHRDGCSFDGDSRNYAEIPGIEPRKLYNNGTVNEAALQILEWCRQ